MQLVQTAEIDAGLLVPAKIYDDLIKDGAYYTGKAVAVFLKPNNSQVQHLVLAEQHSLPDIYIGHVEHQRIRNAVSAVLSSAKVVFLNLICLHVQHNEEYERLEKEFSNLHKHMQNANAIVRQSTKLHILFGQIDIVCKILRCEPVRQGMVGPQTKIIISHSLSGDNLICSSPDLSPVKVDATLTEEYADAFIKGYLNSTLINAVPSANIYLHDLAVDIAPANLTSMDIVEGDKANIAYISLLNLASLGMQNGRWATLILSNENCRNVMICGSDIVSDKTVLVPPPLFYNLKRESHTASLKLLPSDYFPSIAAQVTIAQIPPSYSSESEDIKDWFLGTKRFASNGDVLCVKTLTKMPRLAMFKVTGIEPKESDICETVFYIDPSITRLVQFGQFFMAIPAGVRQFIGIQPPPPPPMSSLYVEMCKVIKSSTNSMFLQPTYQHIPCSLLISGKAKSGKKTMIRNTALELGFVYQRVDCWQLHYSVDKSIKKSVEKLSEIFREIHGPVVLLLDHIEALVDGKKDGSSLVSSELALLIQKSTKSVREKTKFPLVVVGTTLDAEALSTEMIACFQHQFEIKAPTREERFQIMSYLLSKIPIAPEISIDNLAVQTAAFGVGDLVDLISTASSQAVNRIIKAARGEANIPASHLIKAGVQITGLDFAVALDAARARIGDSIGAPKIPQVSWEDVGGLDHVRDEIVDTIQLPLKHPELFSSGLKKRSGVLLYGPPGTGKTHIAKAVATTFSMNFLSVKGPELLNMYIGESEQNVRNLFARAREASPCVLFFDELDSLAPKRGEKGDSNGVMDRIVAQLLAELDDGGGSSNLVFIIGATNRPELLDSALLRPGRFDKLVYLGVSQDHPTQRRILEALTRKFNLSPDVDLGKLSEMCPFNYTGADFYALCSDAMLKSMMRVSQNIEAKIIEMNEAGELYGDADHDYPITPAYYTSVIEPDIRVVVEVQDFERALEELVPSVSVDELNRYLKMEKERSRG